MLYSFDIQNTKCFELEWIDSIDRKVASVLRASYLDGPYFVYVLIDKFIRFRSRAVQ